MKEELKATGMGIGAWFGIVALMLVTGAVVDYTGLVWQSHIGVKRANVERKVFEQTKAYNDGKLQELAQYRHEYNTADAEGKKAIASLVRHQFAGYDKAQLSSDLSAFISLCEAQ